MARKADSGIEWTGPTWNFVRGCNEESAGCANCYARAFAERWRGVPGHPYTQGFELRLVPDHLIDPLGWDDPTPVFVNSMSDLWQKGRKVRDGQRRLVRDAAGEVVRAAGFPWWYLAAGFGVMAACPAHMFQVLTKGPHEAAQFFAWMRATFTAASRLEHARSVVTSYAAHVEAHLVAHPTWRDPSELTAFLPDATAPTTKSAAQRARQREAQTARALARLDAALRAPGPWALPHLHLGVSVENRRALARLAALRSIDDVGLRFLSIEPLLEDLGELDLRGIGWVIVGGESGPHARAFDYAWARAIRDQCRRAGIPFFFKQAGARPRAGGELVQLRAHKGNDLAEIPADLRIREMPRRAA